MASSTYAIELYYNLFYIVILSLISAAYLSQSVVKISTIYRINKIRLAIPKATQMPVIPQSNPHENVNAQTIGIPYTQIFYYRICNIRKQ